MPAPSPPNRLSVRSPRSLAPVLAVLAVFAAAVVALLGPSLAGTHVALPHDLHLDQLPWRVSEAAGPPVNPELRDTIDQYYPVQHQLVRRLRGGQDATWLRGVGLGYPGVEFVGWGALSPFTLPALVLPFDLAWSWGQALRLYAAMLGAYLLVRGLGAGRPGATVAGLSFGLSGFMIGWLGWPQSHVAAVVPWLWWALHHTAGPAPPWWSGPAVAVTTAGLWLGGFPAVAVLALLGGAGAVLAGLTGARRGAPVRALAPAAGVAVGTALAAFTLLPSDRRSCGPTWSPACSATWWSTPAGCRPPTWRPSATPAWSRSPWYPWHGSSRRGAQACGCTPSSGWPRGCTPTAWTRSCGRSAWSPAPSRTPRRAR